CWIGNLKPRISNGFKGDESICQKIAWTGISRPNPKRLRSYGNLMTPMMTPSNGRTVNCMNGYANSQMYSKPVESKWSPESVDTCELYRILQWHCWLVAAIERIMT